MFHISSKNITLPVILSNSEIHEQRNQLFTNFETPEHAIFRGALRRRQFHPHNHRVTKFWNSFRQKEKENLDIRGVFRVEKYFGAVGLLAEEKSGSPRHQAGKYYV